MQLCSPPTDVRNILIAPIDRCMPGPSTTLAARRQISTYGPDRHAKGVGVHALHIDGDAPADSGVTADRLNDHRVGNGQIVEPANDSYELFRPHSRSSVLVVEVLKDYGDATAPRANCRIRRPTRLVPTGPFEKLLRNPGFEYSHGSLAARLSDERNRARNTTDVCCRNRRGRLPPERRPV